MALIAVMGFIIHGIMQLYFPDFHLEAWQRFILITLIITAVLSAAGLFLYFCSNSIRDALKDTIVVPLPSFNVVKIETAEAKTPIVIVAELIGRLIGGVIAFQSFIFMMMMAMGVRHGDVMPLGVTFGFPAAIFFIKGIFMIFRAKLEIISIKSFYIASFTFAAALLLYGLTAAKFHHSEYNYIFGVIFLCCGLLGLFVSRISSGKQ